MGCNRAADRATKFGEARLSSGQGFGEECGSEKLSPIGAFNEKSTDSVAPISHHAGDDVRNSACHDGPAIVCGASRT